MNRYAAVGACALLLWTITPADAAPPKLLGVDLSACANVSADLGQPVGKGKGNALTPHAKLKFALLDPALGNNVWRGDLGATIAFTVSVPSPTAVYTVINTFYGQPGTSNATVRFTGTHGAAATFELIGDVDVRDYNNWIWTNQINGSTTQMWWTNNLSPTPFDQSHRLDVQRFDLQAAFAGETLTGISVTAPANAQPGVMESVLFALGIDGVGKRKTSCTVF